MHSRSALRHTLLACTLATLSLAPAPGRAFYMPSDFDVDATPGPPGQNTSTAVFHYQNDTQTITESVTAAWATQTSPTPTSVMRAEATPSRSMVILPRDVWAPQVVSPDEGTVWTVGSTVKVSWDTSARPKHVTNWEGKVVLGYLEDGDDTNEHLNFNHPLAEGFNLTQGHAMVRVPSVTPGNEYIIVLFGDSGNRSPTFTIVN